MHVLTPEQEKEYYKTQGTMSRPLSPVEWLKTQQSTPMNTKQETSSGVLPSLPDASKSGDLDNLRLALRSALSEAAQNTAKNRMTQLSGLVGGGASPSVIQSAIGLAQSGLQDSRESIYKETLNFVTEEQRMKETKRTSAINMLNTVIDNGVFVDTPAGTLLAWEKEAGLPEGTALAWQARLKIEQDKSEEKGLLELQLLRKELEEKGKPNQPSNFIDIMQKVIDAGGSPEQAAREAALVSEGQGITVDQKILNAWTEQAKKLTKSPSPPPPPPEPEKKGFFDFLKVPPKKNQSLITDKPTVPIVNPFEGYKGFSSADVNSFFSNLFGQ